MSEKGYPALELPADIRVSCEGHQASAHFQLIHSENKFL